MLDIFLAQAIAPSAVPPNANPPGVQGSPHEIQAPPGIRPPSGAPSPEGPPLFPPTPPPVVEVPARVACFTVPWEKALEMFARGFGEAPADLPVDLVTVNGGALVLLVDQKDGSWSVVLRQPQGPACILAGGGSTEPPRREDPS